MSKQYELNEIYRPVRSVEEEGSRDMQVLATAILDLNTRLSDQEALMAQMTQNMAKVAILTTRINDALQKSFQKQAQEHNIKSNIILLNKGGLKP